MKDVDPLIAFAVFVTLVVAAVGLVTALVPMATLWLYSLMLGRVATNSWHRPIAWVGKWWPFAILLIVLNGVLLRTGELAFAVGDVTLLYREGMVAGVFFALRLLVMLTAAATLVAMAPAERFAAGIFRLLQPFSKRLAERAALFGFFAIGFVPLFAREWERVRLAQRFRGTTIRPSLRHSFRDVPAWIVPLISSALRRADQLAIVVEHRDLGSRLARLAVPRGLQPSDVWMLLVTLAVVGIISAGIPGF